MWLTQTENCKCAYFKKLLYSKMRVQIQLDQDVKKFNVPNPVKLGHTYLPNTFSQVHVVSVFPGVPSMLPKRRLLDILLNSYSA